MTREEILALYNKWVEAEREAGRRRDVIQRTAGGLYQPSSQIPGHHRDWELWQAAREQANDMGYRIRDVLDNKFFRLPNGNILAAGWDVNGAFEMEEYQESPTEENPQEPTS